MKLPKFVKRWFDSGETYRVGPSFPTTVPATSAGTIINEHTALSIPAFLHGLRTYGNAIGSQNFDVVHHVGRAQEVDRKHPVHALLHREPNEFQNPSEWKSTILSHAIAWGNGYSYIERNGNFRPTALLPLLPDRTRPFLKDGKLQYVTIVNGKDVILDPYQVFHIKGFTLNGHTGIPLVKLMAATLGLTKAEEEFAARFFGSGALVGGIMTVPGALTAEAQQNLKASMEREYAGLGNAFRVMFLEEGAKFQATTVDPEKSQLIEGRSFQIAEVSRVIGLTPHLLYDLSKATFSNIEHQGIESVVYSFRPWAKKLEEEANRKLLYESEKGEYFTRLDLTPLMAGDAQTQATVDKANFDMLALTPNERRAKIGLNPIDGGDQLFLNTAYLPLNDAVARAKATTALAEQQVTDAAAKAAIDAAETDGQETPAAAPESNDDPPPNPAAGIKDPDGEPGPAVPSDMIDDDQLDRAAVIRPIAMDAIGRIIRRESKALETAVKKHADDPQALREWLANWQRDHSAHIAEVMAPVRAAAAAMKLDLAADYADQYAAKSKASVYSLADAPSDQRSASLATILEEWKQRAAIETDALLKTV